MCARSMSRDGSVPLLVFASSARPVAVLAVATFPRVRGAAMRVAAIPPVAGTSATISHGESWTPMRVQPPTPWFPAACAMPATSASTWMARHLQLARPCHLCEPCRLLGRMEHGCADLCGLGHRLPQVRPARQDERTPPTRKRELSVGIRRAGSARSLAAPARTIAGSCGRRAWRRRAPGRPGPAGMTFRLARLRPWRRAPR